VRKPVSLLGPARTTAGRPSTPLPEPLAGHVPEPLPEPHAQALPGCAPALAQMRRPCKTSHRRPCSTSHRRRFLQYREGEEGHAAVSHTTGVSFYGGSFQSLCAMVFLLTLVSTLLSSLVGSLAEDGEGRRRTADGRDEMQKTFWTFV